VDKFFRKWIGCWVGQLGLGCFVKELLTQIQEHLFQKKHKIHKFSSMMYEREGVGVWGLTWLNGFVEGMGE
jgi:hypothetical protein